jgi:hypothetical protein
MTYLEIASQVARLSLKERLLLLESLAHSVRQDLTAPVERQTGSSLSRVFGLLTPEGPMPTDEELKEGYVDYLIEKYR